jgi:riboflavin-specific deaminase-like protein
VLHDLSELYRPLVESAVFVVGQLGQSLDGRIATPTGHSKYIGGQEALCHLHRLRALADAVVVGAQTVVMDDPELTVRHVEGRSPARVVIDPNGRMPETARLLIDDGVPVLALQSTEIKRPSRITSVTLPSKPDGLCPHDIVTALAARGYRRLLIEGGANTLCRFIAAHALDRLHIAVSPFIIGSGLTGLTLPPVRLLTEVNRPSAKAYHLGADVLFDLALKETG